jgi:hypothetical protein
MLQMGAAALGIAKLPAAKPITWQARLDDKTVAYYEALRKAYEPKWNGILAGIDFAQGPDRTCITFGRWNADGTLTITGHEFLR